MKQFSKIFLSSVLAGVVITFGCAANLMSDNKIAGSVFFVIGLFFICTFNWNLFTGKLPYAKKLKDWLNLLLIWIGNVTGSILTGLLISHSKESVRIQDIAFQLVDAKANLDLLEIFLSAVCCNILIYLAVEGFRGSTVELGKYLSLVFGVSVFVLCGFEHCIADVGYAAIARCDFSYFKLIAVASVGNLVGGRIFSYLHDLSITKISISSDIAKLNILNSVINKR